MSTGRPRLTLAMALGAALAGCGPATYNVRASRAYANEDANPAVVADRTADLERAVALADELLMEAPYSPGDRWIAALHLDDDEADALRDRLEEEAPYAGQYELPLMKLYRMKIDEALRQARAPRAEPARFRGLLAAAATLAPKASALPAWWRALVETRRGLIAAEAELGSLTARVPLGAPDTPQIAAARQKVSVLEAAAGAARQGIEQAAAAIREAAEAPGAPGERPAQRGAAEDAAVILARDLVNAISFVERMQIEALAVAPYVLKQTRRLPRSDGAPQPPSVDRARALGEILEEEREALEPLSIALAAAARMPLSEAAGYEMHEGLLAQATAINFDATHLKLKADADLLFFHAIASAGSSGGTNDYTGRTRRLVYEVDPVFMVGASAALTYDFAHLRNAASLNAGFTTDRLFSEGGDITYDNSLGALLGLDGVASDIFDIGADLAGVSTRAKFATFTSGKVSEIAVDPTTGRDSGVVETAPFQLKYAQIDVGFDFTRIFPEEAEDYGVEAALVGFRYMEYELPRIFYSLHQRTPAEDSTYVIERQSPAQTVASTLYQGGFTLRFGNGEWAWLSPFADIGFYGGAGPVAYHFTLDPATGGGRDDESATMIGLSGNATLGLRLRLTSYRSRPRLVTEISYSAEMIGQGIASSLRGIRKGDETSYVVDKKIDLGGFDLFHGPRLLAVVVF